MSDPKLIVSKLVIPNGDPMDRFFYPNQLLMIDSYIISETALNPSQTLIYGYSIGHSMFKVLCLKGDFLGQTAYSKNEISENTGHYSRHLSILGTFQGI